VARDKAELAAIAFEFSPHEQGSLKSRLDETVSDEHAAHARAHTLETHSAGQPGISASAPGAHGSSWREAKATADAVDTAVLLRPRVMRLERDLESAYRKRVKEAHLSAYYSARAARNDSTRNQLERIERLEQEKQRMATRFSAKLAAAVLAEPECERARADLTIAVEAEARIAERMVREHRTLIRAEAAVREAEVQRERRRADNDQLVSELVALRRKTSQVRVEAAGTGGARGEALHGRCGRGQDEELDERPETNAGCEEVGSADPADVQSQTAVGYDLSQRPHAAVWEGLAWSQWTHTVGEAPASSEMDAEMDGVAASAPRPQLALACTTGPRESLPVRNSGAATRASEPAVAPVPTPVLDARWEHVARPSSAEAQRRRLQAMRAEMHRPGVYQPGGWRTGEQDAREVLLDDLSLDVVHRAAGENRLYGGTWGGVVPGKDASENATPADGNATGYAGGRVGAFAPSHHPATKPAPGVPRNHSRRDPSEVWMSIPGQKHAMPRAQSQPRLDSRPPAAAGSQHGTAGHLEKTVPSRLLSRASSALHLGHKSDVRAAGRGSTGVETHLGTLPSPAATPDHAIAARAGRPSSLARGKLDGHPNAHSNVPSRPGEAPALSAGLQLSTRPYSASPWHCGAGASLAGLPRGIPPRPFTTPQPYAAHCIPVTESDGACHAPSGLLAGWQQVLPRHHAQVRGGGWKKSAQPPRREQEQAAEVAANVVARSGSAVWSTSAAPPRG
jgi:hypothetical protein